MELVLKFIDIFLHIDKHLGEIIQAYGTWTYSILFLIVFCETGLVVTPFLPGDSLLFAAGAFAAQGAMDLRILVVLLIIAAVIGDAVNYHIGKMIGPRAFANENSRFFKKEHLERTQRFYERYGGKTIIIARFVPIIRTFAPFLAGVGTMSYRQFALYNVTGAVLWVVLFCVGGYCFSELRIVKENFSLVILAIIIISVMPAVYEYVRAARSREAQS
ncbi:MAG TPA: DedA family protein [Oligoflexia bacterium]|nr:DedA family protein [Oligoflexia bacterium]